MKLGRSLLHLALWCFFVLGVPALFIARSFPMQADVSFSLGRFSSQVLPSIFGLLLAGIVAAWLASGFLGVRRAWAWIRGGREEETAALASLALSTASRTILSMGVVAPLFMLVATGAYLARVKQDPSFVPPGAANGFVGVMFAPLFALLIGRGVLGSLATRAATIAGLPADRSLRGWSGFAVPLLIVVIVCILIHITIYPVS